MSNSYELTTFQEATANRIVNLFNDEGQKRVLLADEVGLGKTIVASGVIKLMDEGRKNKRQITVYFCPSQSIARQNVLRLAGDNNSDVNKSDDDNSIPIEESRLSMLHLQLAKHESKPAKQRGKLFISMTPETSLKMVQKAGTGDERALMYRILRKYFQQFLHSFQDRTDSKISKTTRERLLNELLNPTGIDGWDNKIKKYQVKIDAVEGWYKEKFYDKLKNELEDESNFAELKDYFANTRYKTQITNFKDFFNYLFETSDPKPKRDEENYEEICKNVILHLRRLFAKITCELLNPDLVIMDEFQRYDYLVKPDRLVEDMEQKVKKLDPAIHNLIQTLLNNNKVLLLSATPYKPYYTSEELNNNHGSSREFKKIISFLLGNKAPDFFENQWKPYTKMLNKFCHEPANNDVYAEVKRLKSAVETTLSRNICRTERQNNENFLKPQEVTIDITKEDVLSWINIKNITRSLPDNVEADNRIIDYIKSSPYLLSFMGSKECNYTLFTSIQNHFSYKRSRKLPHDKTSFIPVTIKMDDKKQDDKKKDDASFKYKKIQTNNARLKLLLDTILPEKKQTELLLWVPASKPYYDASSQKGAGKKHPVGDIFSKNKGFSKLLAFSHWAMVPPMTSAMVSFEADRRVFEKGDYYKTKRVTLDDARGDLLAYPSKKLADINIYELVQKSENKTLDELALKVSEQIKDKILKSYPTDKTKQQNNAPRSLNRYLTFLEHLDNNDENSDVPPDAVTVLTWLAIASPGVCILRTLKNNWTDEQIAKIYPEAAKEVISDKNESNDDEDDNNEEQSDTNRDSFYTAQDIAKEIARKGVLSIFERQDSQKIIDKTLKTQGMKDDVMCKSYSFRVVRYCAEGNFQAVMDELAFQCKTAKEFYDHFVYESTSRSQDANNPSEENDEKLRSCLAPRGRITVQTRSSFLYPKSKKPIVFRTGFALALSQTESSDEKVFHSERIRKAFNSPFRPFVLSTTSIGQEGLDFHAYCRKIMHWNLPQNPIDLEQREGRINRYMSLAIRQSLANSEYADGIAIDNFWRTLVGKVALEDNNKSGGMVPYWILPKDFEFKYPIERIVPAYPYSKDQDKYSWIIKVLSMYRLTLGQPNQEELLRSLDNANIPKEQLDELFFNLSPFFGKQKEKAEAES